jgi:hypothetical protein
MRFAHLKVQHGFERMRLRGLTGARDEFHLAATVQRRTLATISASCGPMLMCFGHVLPPGSARVV